MEYVYAVGRRWWVVVILVVLGGAGAMFSLAHTSSTFRAEAQLLVTPQPAAGGPIPSTDYIESRAQAYAVIASSAPFSAEVRAKVGGQGAFPQYQATVQNGTTVIVVSAMDLSPSGAARTAAVVADLVVARSQALDGSASRGVRLQTTIVADPVADVSPSSPNAVVVISTGLGVGWILGLAFAYVLGRRRGVAASGSPLRRYSVSSRHLGDAAPEARQ